MLTAGIDLSADPKKTGVATLEWTDDGATVTGIEVGRTGRAGPVVEVYPAAALKLWGLPHQGYKGREPANARRRAALVQLIGCVLPWLQLGEYADLCIQTDDALDAVLCAAIAGLARRGETDEIPTEHLAAAAVEGWIALPVRR
ncbi:DUF429 domain-containing protein [Nocardioides daphniae]|nr:DUF429 domain-containing protein [Nocardioides daphniae]GGD10631.1 hypothetical protein GCM10007231_06740 [Nocardioides daphniae]